MDSLQKSLSNLRAYYKEHGGPNFSAIADASGLSDSTVSRYLGKDVIKTPNYDSIVSIATVIGMGTEDLTLNKELVDQIENKEQLRELILELRKINIEELSRRDDQWRDRLDAEKQAHSEDIRHLTEAHNAQLERLQRVYADQMAELTSASLGVHQKESDHIQQTAQMQYESLQKIAETQKDADERAKAYLMRQVRTWKIISFLLVFTLILLLVVDLRNPDKGWIKFIGSKLFSMRGVA